MKYLLLPLLLVSCAAARTPSPSLRLEFGDGLCSGTAVGRTTILTAAHCVEGDPLSAVDDVETHAIRIVRDGHDHALVTVDRVIGGHLPRVAAPEIGQKVHWTGNPNGMRAVYREGYVAAIDEKGNAYLVADGYYGDSGSGVYAESGELVGVVSAGLHWARPQGLEMQMIVLMPFAYAESDWKAVR